VGTKLADTVPKRNIFPIIGIDAKVILQELWLMKSI